MKQIERPLSPHLSVYKPQITSVLSILNRITGVALSVGLIALTYWLLAIAGGSESYADMKDCLGGILGKLLIFGWTFAFFYHLCNGIRHLYWDTGRGFEPEQVTRSGIITIVATVFLTVLALFCAYSGGAA